MQSPTTLLSNIQSMRQKLRQDKQLLNGIKRDFSQLSKRSYCPDSIENINEQSGRNVTPPASLMMSTIEGRNKSNEKKERQKVIETKKEHMKELRKIRQDHQKQIQALIDAHGREKRQILASWKEKVEQQAKYIAILESQVSNPSPSPIQSERQAIPYEQYDTVINQLLRENTKLHNQLRQAHDDSESWRKHCRHLSQEHPLKSRLKFNSKATNNSEYESSYNPTYNSKQNISKTTNDSYCYVSKSQVESIYHNDQNIDRSNIVKGGHQRWEDEEILNDQGGLKTIRQFPLLVGSRGQKSRAGKC